MLYHILLVTLYLVLVGCAGYVENQAKQEVIKDPSTTVTKVDEAYTDGVGSRISPDDEKPSEHSYLGNIVPTEPLARLSYYIRQGNVEACRMILEKHGNDIVKSKITSSGFFITPLIMAAGEGHKEIVALFLDAGANPIEMDSFGDTALDVVNQKMFKAVENNNAYQLLQYEEIIKLLKQKSP